MTFFDILMKRTMLMTLIAEKTNPNTETMMKIGKKAGGNFPFVALIMKNIATPKKIREKMKTAIEIAIAPLRLEGVPFVWCSEE